MHDIVDFHHKDGMVIAGALKRFLQQLPADPGIYKMLDATGTILYVGKASNLKKRVSSYFNKPNVSVKTRSLVSQITSIQITVTRSETEALLLESSFIKSIKPKYNILLRDDKTYPYIHISKHANFPRIESYRSKKKPTAGLFFGPYPSGFAVKQAIDTIEKIFLLRNCADSYFNARSRPCLQYQIKRCTAPCVQYISPEDYQKNVEDAVRFLQGKSQEIIQEQEQLMACAALELNFEKAALIRDRIKSLRVVQEQQGVIMQKGDADVIVIDAKLRAPCIFRATIRLGQIQSSQSYFPKIPSIDLAEEASDKDLWQELFVAFIQFYYLDNDERIPSFIITDKSVMDKKTIEDVLFQQSGHRCKILTNPRGNNAKWLSFANNNLNVAVAEFETKHATMQARYHDLVALLSLKKPIERMECFDISHTQGEATIASCVVFDKDGPKPSQYRRFNITGITKGDDYAAMHQALERRFKSAKSDVLPDVLIIDGGKGQVAKALQVLTSLNIQDVYLLGIAKGPERKAGEELLILVNSNQEIKLPNDAKALHLLQHIRDEAHRFAITSHRKKRQKARTESVLEQIEGIGAKKRQALLQRFGGIRDLAKASIEELCKVPGVNRCLAERVFKHFHDAY